MSPPQNVFCPQNPVHYNFQNAVRTELHNKKNIEISKLLRGYWTLVIGLMLFVCWLIFAYVYTFNVQATSKLSIVSLVLYVVEMIINAIIVKRTAPHLE